MPLPANCVTRRRFRTEPDNKKRKVIVLLPSYSPYNAINDTIKENARYLPTTSEKKNAEVECSNVIIEHKKNQVSPISVIRQLSAADGNCVEALFAKNNRNFYADCKTLLKYQTTLMVVGRNIT